MIKHTALVLFILFLSRFSFAASLKIEKLQMNHLFSNTEMYSRQQISRSEFWLRIIDLQKRYQWNMDQVSYLKDFFKKTKSVDSFWEKPYCQIISFFRTDFYLDYSESLAECSQWPKRKIDLQTMNRRISVFGVPISISQLQDAEVYELDYVLIENRGDHDIVAVAPIEEYLLRDIDQDMIPSQQRERSSFYSSKIDKTDELQQEVLFDKLPPQETFYQRNRYLVWGLTFIAGAFAYPTLQRNEIKIQY